MSAAAGHQLTAPPTLVEVAEDVYAYTELPGGWCVANAGVVLGPEGALVVDTLSTEHRARRFAGRIDELGAGRARMVVNTHHHGDHSFGNHLFGDAAIVIGHDLARTEMAETGLALTQLWPDVPWGDVRVTLPSMTFQDRLTVHIGARRAELIYVGPAHTTNDVVVWLPEERVLFAGDVVLSGATPFLLMGSLSGSLAAVRRLAELGARTVVCGHGPVAGPEVFDETIAYLEWLQLIAAGGAAQRLAPLELARQADTSLFDYLLDPERIVGNLHRAYAELAGGALAGPLDVPAVFAEIVEYNGGRTPTCLA